MAKKTTAVGIIPARWASTRFPGKPLYPIQGKPLLQWVYERVLKTKSLSEIIIATDDRRILDAAKKWGANVVMTSPKHATGGDRLAEVAQKLRSDIIVNIQGDEPLIRPTMIDALVKSLASAKDIPVATFAHEIEQKEELTNPNVVKVVFNKRNQALYFSRYCIPFIRNPEKRDAAFYKHLGIYAYRRDFLLKFVKMKSSRLEQLESLEQLRILENGYPIQIVLTKFDSVGVDTPQDVARVEKQLLASQAASA